MKKTKLPLDIPKICTQGEMPTKNYSWSPLRIPGENDYCEICHSPWTINNCEDTMNNSNKSFIHKNCYKLKETQIVFEELHSIFKIIFKYCIFKPIPNEYYPCNICTDWYEVETPTLTFKVGWRKRVISLELISENNVDFNKLFEKEDVTKGKNFIHAWGYGYLLNYLEAISYARN